MIGISELEVAGRLLLGALLGGGIGPERQVHGRMTCRMTIASEHRISEREIVEELARFPAVRQIRVHA